MTTTTTSSRKSRTWKITILGLKSYDHLLDCISSISNENNHIIAAQCWLKNDTPQFVPTTGILNLNQSIYESDSLFDSISSTLGNSIKHSSCNGYDRAAETLRKKDTKNFIERIEPVVKDEEPEEKKSNTKQTLTKKESKGLMKVAQLIYYEETDNKKDIVKKLGPSALIYDKQIDVMLETKRSWDRNVKKIIPFNPPEPHNRYGKNWYKIMRWMFKCLTMKKDHPNYNKRRKHLWVYGDSGLGKTEYLVNVLTSMLKCWEIMPDGNFNEPYDTKEGYQLIYADEYDGSKKIEFLNNLCNYKQDGMLIRQFGNVIRRTDYPCVLIVSNPSPEQIYCYHKYTSKFRALMKRFYVVKLEERGNPFEIDQTKLDAEKEIDKYVEGDDYNETDDEDMKEPPTEEKINDNSKVDDYLKKHPEDRERLLGINNEEKKPEPVQEQIAETITEYKEDKEPIQTKIDDYIPEKESTVLGKRKEPETKSSEYLDKFLPKDKMIEDIPVKETVDENNPLGELPRCSTPPRELSMDDILDRMDLDTSTDEYKIELENEIISRTRLERLKRQKLNK